MRNIYYYSKISTLMSANRLFYSISRIPFLKRLEVSQFYKNEKLKNVIGVIGFLIEILKNAIGNSAFVWLFVVYIPDLLTSSQSFGYVISPEVQQSLYLLIFCLAPAFLQSVVFHAPEKDFPFLSYFQINPKTYYLLKIVRYCTRNLLVTPVLYYVFKEPVTVLMLVMFDITATLLCNAIFLRYFKEKGSLPDIKARYLLAFALVLLTYVGLFWGKIPGLPNDRLFHLIIILALATISVACWFYSIKYDRYHEIAAQYANKHVAALRVSITSTLNEDDVGLKNSSSDDNIEYLAKHESLTPQNYIERAFLYRFRKPIVGFIRDKIFWNLSLCILIGLLIKWGFIVIDNNKILNYSPVMLSLVLSMTYGRVYFQLCFRNIDLPLLHLQLFTKDKIQRSIWKRLAFILLCGSIMFVFFSLSFFALIQLGGIMISTPDFFSLLGIYLLVYLIYEIYNAIAYYLFQPYSTELTIKHPVYIVLSVAESLFSVLVLFSRSNVIELIKPLGVTLFVLIIGLILLSTKVDTTFKLRL